MLTDRAIVGLREATHRDRVLTAREDLLTYVRSLRERLDFIAHHSELWTLDDVASPA